MDVLLSDAMLYQMLRYDTLVVAHRLTSEPGEARRKLEGYVRGGGHLVITASTVHDLGGLFNISMDERTCESVAAGARVRLSNDSEITEPFGFVLCNVTAPAAAKPLAWISGAPVAFEFAEGNGTLTFISAGNYSMTELTPGPHYNCTADEVDTRDTQPYRLVEYTRTILTGVLSCAALFDLGDRLSWVPKRLSSGKYSLLITNQELNEVPLKIASKIGEIASLTEVTLDRSEQGHVGYFPHGFENASLGENSATQIAGGDTRLFTVVLSSDTSVSISAPPPPPPPHRLLRLSHLAGDLRLEILRRPSFGNHYTGVLLDWSYFASRSADALKREAR